MLKSQKYSEQSIPVLNVFPFHKCNAQESPFSVQDYPADVRRTEGSQHHRVVELENALQMKSEEVIRLRTASNEMKKEITLVIKLFKSYKESQEKNVEEQNKGSNEIK